MITINKISGQEKNTAVLCLLPLMLILIVGPMEIYSANITEFKFLFTQFFFWYFLATAVLTIVSSIILDKMPDKVSGPVKTIIFAVSIAMYFQNNLMNKYIFSSDGSSVEWEKVKSYSLFTTIVWLVIVAVIIAVSIFLKEKAERIQTVISSVLILVLAVTTISMIISCMSKELERDHYVLSGEKQYTLAKDENVIIFILDRYTNDEFEKFCKNHPDKAVAFKDFTYYDNAESCYAFTFPSLDHILTGIDPDIEIQSYDWQKYAWNTDRCKDFYNRLHADGYECRLYSSDEAYIVLGNLSYLIDSYDNLTETVPRKDNALLLKLLTKMSLYKYAPYALKPKLEIASSAAFKDVLVYDNGDGTVEYYNYEFNDGIDDEGVKLDETNDKAFIVYHISGTHDYYNDENGHYVEEESNNIDATKVGLAYILDKYMNEMKQLGVYDNSTIIMMGDHGYGITRKIDAQPVFMIKKANEIHDEMAVTSAPISYDDIQSTILSTIGDDYKSSVIDYGTSIFDWKDGDVRTRTYRALGDGFYSYTYTGNRSDLNILLENGDYVREYSDLNW